MLTFGTEPGEPRTGRFAIVGDLQRTSAAEVWRPSNRDELERLVSRIAAEPVDAVVLLGDLVFRGSSPAQWAAFDALFAPLARREVPVVPVLGNHEYWVTGRAALRRYFERFPSLSGRHFYERRYGPLALLALDSNARWLTREEHAAQSAFLREALTRLDADPLVRGVLVLVHHPPFTNSMVTADDLWVQAHVVPPFLAAKKTLAMLSGHVHSYERFLRGGKVFVVAGGGGPRVRLAREGKRRHLDDLATGPMIRPFHFLLATLRPEGLELETLGMDAGTGGFRELDAFDLRYPGGEGGPPGPPSLPEGGRQTVARI